MKKNNITKFILILLIVSVLGFFIYVSDYYKADEIASKALDSDNINVEKIDQGYFFDGPSNSSAFIFYPGAKVEASAYAPLLHELAKCDLDIYLLDVPFNIAFFDMNEAKEIIDNNQYDNWYIGGHSLGGVVASNYLINNPDYFKGLILLASYTTKQVPEDIIQISIIGSNDEIINWERVEEGKLLSAADYYELIIEGGNHCQFGSYGFQKGDGIANISSNEQIEQTVEYINNIIKE